MALPSNGVWRPSRGLRGIEILGQPVSCSLLELNATLALCVPDSPLVELAMEEVVTDHLVLRCVERVLDITEVAHVQSIPVYKVSAAVPTLPALLIGHLPQLLEAMEIVLAVRRCKLDVEPRRLLEFGNSDRLSSGHDQAAIDQPYLRYGRDAAQ
ncbi:MAG: hypothetical protein OXC26_09770 [Albidovulum sp.]|nr:hypothetical protein [Albidovulum sp.]